MLILDQRFNKQDTKRLQQPMGDNSLLYCIWEITRTVNSSVYLPCCSRKSEWFFSISSIVADFFLSPFVEFVGLINQLDTVVVELTCRDLGVEIWFISKLSCFSCKNIIPINWHLSDELNSSNILNLYNLFLLLTGQW